MNLISNQSTYPDSINQLHPTTSNSQAITDITDATQNIKGSHIIESQNPIQGTDKLNLRSRSASSITSPQSHVATAHQPCLQPPPQDKLNPELKAAITRYIERKKNTPIPFTDYKILLDYFRRPLPEMDFHKLDNDVLAMALKAPDFWLNDIPADRLTRNLCSIACLSDSRNLQYVPFDFKDKDLCQTACVNAFDPIIIEYVPEHILSEWAKNGFFESLYSLKGGEFLQYIPKGYITDDILAHACKTMSGICRLIPPDHPNRNEWVLSAFEFHPGAIEFMPDKMITPEISQAACEKDGAYFMYVPDRHKTLDLCRIACKSSYGVLDQLPSWLTAEERSELYGIASASNASALAFIPDIFKTYDMCKQACLHLKKGLIIKYLPEHLNTEELQALYKMACISSEGDAFQYIPDDRKTDELYQLALNMWTSSIKKNCMAYFEIPGRYRTTDLFNIAMEELTPEFINNLTEIDSVSRLPYIPVSLQFKLLTNAKTSTDDKLHLIDLIEHINYQPHTSLPSRSCITTTSPLVSQTRNQHLNHLIIASYRSRGFEPENISRGHEIDNYGKLKTSDILPTHFPEELSASNNQHQIMVGGRTIQITSKDKSGKNIYFKFQRKGEKLQELVKEGFIYEYIQNHPEIQQHFNSELPTLRGFMKIPLDLHLEAIIKNFPDPVDIHEDSGQRFINVFSYAAPPDYSKYAYLPDSATDQPCKKPEQGILDACHDAGFLASMGLILTSMLPAFHDTATVRRWVALHNAFNERNGVHPGTFVSWNTDATGKPDFGHCGIRDIGDYELFGQIKSILQHKDTNDCTHTFSSTQNLALANAICENILAALLIRSRLRQQFEDYHYQNPEAVAQTARFIESVCNEFLSGFNTSISSVNPPENYLKKMLQITDADYQQWLHRAAQELVYWTGLQPGEEGYESFRQSLFNHNECYLNHIEQGKLSPELYPEATKTEKTKACFYNINGRLNLGAHNSTFPLITLLNGLIRGVTAQLMRSATHSG